jgi:hypothetical protein
MGTRTQFSSQVSADGRFTELEVQRSLSDVTLAQTHAVGRNRRVGAVLCYLSLMKSRDLVPKGAKARVVGAKVQDFKSADGYEAAHYLPGQLKISIPGKGDIEPWNLVKNVATASEIASLFSAVQNLPSNFNKADSYLEMHAKPSLKLVLAEVSGVILREPSLPAGKTNVDSVRGAYKQWIHQSMLSYRAAINRKIDIAELDELPPSTAPAVGKNGAIEPHELNLSLVDLLERAVRKGESGQSTSTVWDYSEQVRILGHYLTASQDCVLSDMMIRDIESTFRP